MVEEQPQKVRPKKRKMDSGPKVIEVPCGDTTIACLMQGQRPTKSNLVVPLKEDRLMPIFVLLHQDQDKESLKHRKAYNRSKTPAVAAENEEPKG